MPNLWQLLPRNTFSHLLHLIRSPDCGPRWSRPILLYAQLHSRNSNYPSCSAMNTDWAKPAALGWKNVIFVPIGCDGRRGKGQADQKRTSFIECQCSICVSGPRHIDVCSLFIIEIHRAWMHVSVSQVYRLLLCHFQTSGVRRVANLGGLYMESEQTLQCFFSALLKPKLASKNSCESSRRDLQKRLLWTALLSIFCLKLSEFL